MKRAFILLAATIMAFHWLSAQDTFSVIAVDSATGEVGATGASCVDGISNWGGIIVLNDIIPGRGGVNAQAWICLNPHINLNNAIARMGDGMSPQEIIDWLQLNDACSAQSYNPEYRQYGVVDFDSMGSPRAAAFTGTQADDYKGHRVGANYAIQGNILLGPEILDSMEARFNRETGPLAYKLMAAMQGANVPGADSRCLARGTSSTSAFLRVVKPGDDPLDPYVELAIDEMPFGEEPIDSLQTLFNAWCCDTLPPPDGIEFKDPLKVNVTRSSEGIRIMSSQPLQQLELYSLAGQRVYARSMHGVRITTVAMQQPSGCYVAVLTDVEGRTSRTKLVF